MSDSSLTPAPPVPDNPIAETDDKVRYPLGRYFGEYDESGVDLSLLRWFLKLTPLERLVEMEAHARDTLKLLEYGRQFRESKAPPHR